jgi:hypothetical protein
VPASVLSVAMVVRPVCALQMNAGRDDFRDKSSNHAGDIIPETGGEIILER